MSVVNTSRMKKQNSLIVILGLIVAASLGLNIYLASITTQELFETKTFKVIEVFDGDSFSIPPDQTIRLAGIDAPALEFCYGQEAKEALEGLILGKKVMIEKTAKDSFGRTIGLVYYNEVFINQALVEGGWARYASGGGVGKEITARLQEQAQKAKENQLGLWGQCYQLTNPINPDCDIKGNFSRQSEGIEKIYHYPGCSEYEQTVVELDLGEEWFCSEEEATKAGFIKAEHCFTDYQKPKTPSFPSS